MSTFWRVFPWDPHAPDGAPFSARYVPPASSQTGGRFNFEGTAILYLAQSPAHAVAEVLQGFRGKTLKSEHLVHGNPEQPRTYHPLSVVKATLPHEIVTRLPDFTEPMALLQFGLRPDQLASHERFVTQAIAREVHADPASYAGFRWWSALTGEWHVTVLFLDRVDVASIDYATPEPLHIADPAVREAARFLDISLVAA